MGESHIMGVFFSCRKTHPSSPHSQQHGVTIPDYKCVIIYYVPIHFFSMSTKKYEFCERSNFVFLSYSLPVWDESSSSFCHHLPSENRKRSQMDHIVFCDLIICYTSKSLSKKKCSHIIRF